MNTKISAAYDIVSKLSMATGCESKNFAIVGLVILIEWIICPCWQTVQNIVYYKIFCQGLVEFSNC